MLEKTLGIAVEAVVECFHRAGRGVQSEVAGLKVVMGLEVRNSLLDGNHTPAMGVC